MLKSCQGLKAGKVVTAIAAFFELADVVVQVAVRTSI